MQCSLEQVGRGAACTGSPTQGGDTEIAGQEQENQGSFKERRSHGYQKQKDTVVILIKALFWSSYQLSVLAQISYTAANNYFISLSYISTCSDEITAIFCFTWVLDR